ncbi:MAG: hypothetical protein JW751_15525 [Polyangiaceae bacterium]|nr:hypothetical protein [Polyangiaceae bacterium]
MALDLPRDSLLAIVAVAWADGLLKQNESSGLLRAAAQCGLAGEDLAAIETATREGVSLEAIDLGGLSDWQKGLTYALAYWLAKVDGVVNAQELGHLRRLGEMVGLHKLKLEAAQSAVFDVTCLPGGHRPDKYDFSALAERLRIKLPSLIGSK